MPRLAKAAPVVVCLVVALPIVVFRLPSGPARESVGPVWFRYISFTDPVRGEFERWLGNAPIWLESGEVVYVPARVRAELWAQTPDLLARRNQRLVLRFKARPLLFGGQGPASSVRIEMTPGRNRISK